MEKNTFTTKLYEVCSSDELRPLLMCVHFKNKFAYASDAHAIVKQSLEYHTILGVDFLENKAIHKDNYKAIMGFETAEAKEDGVACSDSDGRTAFFEYYDKKGAEPPNFDEFIKPIGQKSIEFIGINPEIMSKIGKAMHAPDKVLRLQFQGVDKSILIDTPIVENQWAILMPAIINDSLFNQ